MVFIPLWDKNPLRVIPFQFTTVTVIAFCIGVFALLKALPDPAQQQVVVGLGLIPAVLFQHLALLPPFKLAPAEITIVSSMFIHVSWWHLITNMAVLWVFGDNVEDAMGHWRFGLFLLLCGIAASVVHAISLPRSISPTIGFSGAVSGVVGGYLLLHPRVKVLALAFARIPVYLPAYVIIGAWLALQVIWAIYPREGTQGIALWAHIGGFGVGALLVLVFRRRDVPLFDGEREAAQPKILVKRKSAKRRRKPKASKTGR